MAALHRLAAMAIVRAWPFPFAHLRLMDLLGATPPSGRMTGRLRGYPLQMTFQPETYIGRSLYFRGMYEEEVVSTIAARLKPGMTFLDIGANIGLHTIVAAHRVGHRGRVIAIEPQSGPRRELLANLALNRLTNVHVCDCAIGAEERMGDLSHLSANNSGLATMAPSATSVAVGVERVQVRPLARVLEDVRIARVDGDVPELEEAERETLERYRQLSRVAEDVRAFAVDGIKIDVEGGEMEVLAGAEAYLRQHPPSFLLIECIDEHLRRFGSSSRALVTFLQGLGYEVRALVRGRWRLVGPGEGISADLLAVRSN
jgi:FkbM family methyltransferase